MTDTGGPAFPQHGFDTIAERFTSQGGMTLRDYFAAKAMQSYLTLSVTQEALGQLVSPEKYCDMFYQWADHMLKARQK